MKKQTAQVAPPSNKRELSELLDALAPVFNFPRAIAERYGESVGIKNFRIVRLGSNIAGGLALLHMGQYFGGRRVPMTGIALVGVRPEYRGSGVGKALMHATIRELHQRGVPISALYPATMPLYRSAGYELAGSRFEMRLALRQLELDGPKWPVRRISAKDRKEIESLYRSIATNAAGYLDRIEISWKRVEAPRGATTQGFAAINPETRRIEGYLYYLQKESPDAAYMLSLSDFVASTPEAARRLLAFLRDHRSMADFAIWCGSAADPILLSVPERVCKAKLLDHWMVRIVDVPGALKARGYADSIHSQIHFDVRDELLPANHGRWKLTVQDGKAKVERGGNGNLEIDIRGLAPLYTGHLSAYAVGQAGLLRVSENCKSPERLMSDATAVFAGAAPAMSDMF